MTAKDLLELNGDFRRSPLLDTARKRHRLPEQSKIPCVIVGGLSLVSILELKTVARDLADVVELLTNYRDRLSGQQLETLHPVIRTELEQIMVRLRKGKR